MEISLPKNHPWLYSILVKKKSLPRNLSIIDEQHRRKEGAINGFDSVSSKLAETERKTRRRGIKTRRGGARTEGVFRFGSPTQRKHGGGRSEKKILFHPGARPAACTRRYPHTCREYILIRWSPGLNIYASCRLRCKSPQPSLLPPFRLCIFVQTHIYIYTANWNRSSVVFLLDGEGGKDVFPNHRWKIRIFFKRVNVHRRRMWNRIFGWKWENGIDLV